jgi:hypothetical protein
MAHFLRGSAMADVPPAEMAAFADYVGRCEAAWRALFDAAFERNEVQAAVALTPEFRGMQDAGWNTAEEAHRAKLEYVQLIRDLEGQAVGVRVALSLYSHLSEASGFYEVPKNMLRLISGEDYNGWPFQHLVRRHEETGGVIAPNANKVMRDLLGHADEVGQDLFRDLVTETFDPDLRNGYAHADYIIRQDGIRLRRRNGGRIRVVNYPEFHLLLNKALVFFDTLGQEIQGRRESYAEPKRLIGRFNSEDPLDQMEISYNPENGIFRIRTVS